MIINPYSDNKWFLFGDESGSSVPKDELRYACYTVVGIPVVRYDAVRKELPERSNKKGFEICLLDRVYKVLRSNGGVALGVYFDLKSAGIDELVSKLEVGRKKSDLKDPPSIAFHFWTYLVGFSFIETLGLIAREGLPVGDIEFKYDGRTLHKHVKAILKQFVGDEIVQHMNRILKEVEPYDSDGLLKKAKPNLIAFGAGKTRESGIMIADLCARYVFLRLSNKTKIAKDQFKIKNLTELLRVRD